MYFLNLFTFTLFVSLLCYFSYGQLVGKRCEQFTEKSKEMGMQSTESADYHTNSNKLPRLGCIYQARWPSRRDQKRRVIVA